MSDKIVPPSVSQYMSQLGKKGAAKTNAKKLGFANPETLRKALETRKKHAKKNPAKSKKQPRSEEFAQS